MASGSVNNVNVSGPGGIGGAVAVTAVLIAGLAVRIVYAMRIGYLGGGDTASYGLMAKHILEAKDLPVYVPMAHYSGSAASYLMAAVFKLFGVSLAAVNFTAVIFSFLWMVVIFLIARELLDLTGVIAALILAALPFHKFLVDYSLTVGNRADSYLFASLALLIFIKWIRGGYEYSRAILISLGLSSGLALWTTPNAVPLLLTIITAVIFCGRKNLFKKALFVLFGFVAGYAPALIYNFQNPGATFFRMAGRVLALDRGALSAPDLTRVIAERLLWRASEIPAAIMRVPYLVAALIGIPGAVLFAGSVLLALKERGLKREPLKDAWGVLCLYVLWAVLFYAVLIQEDRYRYISSLCMVSPLFAGYLFSRIGMRSRPLMIALLSALLAYNCYIIVYSFPSRGVDRYSELADRLSSTGLRYGFSDYDTAYIAQLATQETSVISPTLFHPTFSDRWPADTERVRSAPDVFYIVDIYKDPEAAPAIEKACTIRGIHFRKESVRGFEIYHGFSSKIYPEEITWSE